MAEANSTLSTLPNGPAGRDGSHPDAGGALSTVASASGYVLGVSYPVLALSTGVRAAYQLFFKQGGLLFTGQPSDYLGALLTAVAATLYLVATIGFIRRSRRAWRVSVAALATETVLTIVVGTLTLPMFEIGHVIGGTVWRWYGADYGFFPLFQPILGLVWLFWPVTMRAYGIERRLPWTSKQSIGGAS